ncbi:MAG: YajQ family cyclic di-GMP-binding protein [Halobacteriovorax sp.]|nr:YajQ family cyclic di-GMP-binding protein [Halobacteriovorax sp.]
MPSFDLVSKLDVMELKNVIQLTEKEVGNRYDFKGAKITFDLKDSFIELTAPDDYKIGAALEIFRKNMGKRGIGQKAIEPQDVKPSGNQQVKQTILFKSGIDKELGKKINKIVKNSGMKITSAYLDEKIRITGKKIDDLQSAFQMIKNHDDVNCEVKMENMKS